MALIRYSEDDSEQGEQRHNSTQVSIAW